MTTPFKLPLEVFHFTSIQFGLKESGSFRVAAIATTFKAADALVRAVNAHEKLVKAVKAAAAVMARGNTSMTVEEIASIRDAAALAAAEGNNG